MSIKSTDIITLTLASIFLASASGNLFSDPAAPPAPRIAPNDDDRITLSTMPGSPYESIGVLITGAGKCTNAYQGSNTTLSAAHCFGNIASAPVGSLRAAFYLARDEGGTKNFRVMPS